MTKHRFSRVGRWLVAGVLAVGLVVQVAPSVPAEVRKDSVPADWAPDSQIWKPVPHQVVGSVDTPRGGGPSPMVVGKPVWPAAGTFLTSGRQGQRAQRAAGVSPVRVTSVGQASVQVLPAQAAQKVGPNVLLVAVTAPQGELSAEVEIDYAGFAEAGGAGFGQRLQIVSLPACAVDTPEKAECLVPVGLDSSNDPDRQTVTARLSDTAGRSISKHTTASGHTTASTTSVGGGQTTVLAVMAGASGSNGSFAGSSLAGPSKWGVSGSTGTFSWNYPLISPPAGNQSDVVPEVSLSYNSGAVDGRIASTNNQPGWIGQGWSYEPGFVERTYVTCADQAKTTVGKTQDLCWQGEVINLSLGGSSSTLVKDDTTGAWHPQEDNGTRVQRLTGASNGALDGEYWRVTMPDGLVYEFGRTYGPGRTTQAGTNSTWTVPVYGAKAGDPCYSSSGFASSRCVQGWRWNLDYVADTRGNVAMYYYNSETNHYKANNGATTVSYVRGGTLARIEYGLVNSAGSVYGASATAKVEFTTAERCIPTAGFTCAESLFTAANAAHWPDTPQDQACSATGTCLNWAPTFWSRKRLTEINTFVLDAGSYTKLDRYALAQSYPDNGDRALWLNSITHTGYTGAGESLTEAPITFNGTLMDNRVDGYRALAPMMMWRVTSIVEEDGGLTTVSYTAKDCTATSVPNVNDLQNNTRRCFPVMWASPGQTDPSVDFFHKYMVTSVRQQDPAAETPNHLTSYTYVGTPAWHFDDNELVKATQRTYGQFRGYGQVEVRTGDPSVNTVNGPDKQTLTRTWYHRGMHGDRLPSGVRTVNLTNSVGEVIADHDYLNGQVLEQQTFNGSGGALISKQLSDYSLITTTATHQRTGLPDARAVVVAATKQRSINYNADSSSSQITTSTRYDARGRAVAVTETAGAKSTCSTTSYAENTTSNILLLPAEESTYAGTCPASGVPAGQLRESQRYFYDGSTTLGQVPGAGNQTRGQTAVSSTEYGHTTTGFDSSGRAILATEYTGPSDTTGRTFTTSFTTSGGRVTAMTTTNPLGQQQVQYFDLRGRIIKTVSVAGLVTETSYDALGRPTAIWDPGFPRTGPATTKFSYTLAPAGLDAVKTETLVSDGTTTSYLTSIELYDSMGQLVQTQTDGVGGGRVINDSFYDSHGWVVGTNNHWFTTGVPSFTRVTAADSAIDSRTVISYDGIGRATTTVSYQGLVETRRSRVIHSGDSITQIPPAGGTTTQTMIDVEGNTTELRLYTSPPTVTGSIVSGGQYTKTLYEHDHDGQVIKLTDATGAVWTHTYDLSGRLTSSSDPDAGTTTFTTNWVGDQLTTTDARGSAGTVSYTYDALGRKTSMSTGVGPTLKVQGTWVYDTIKPGMLSESRTHLNGNAADVLVQKATGYNTFGAPTGTQVIVPASQGTLAGTYATTMTYTSTGQPKTVTMPAAGGLPAETLTYAYTAQGQPYGMTGTNQYVTKTVYNPFGQVSQITGREGGTLVWSTTHNPETLDVASATFSAATAQSQVAKQTYTYDPSGKITRVAANMYYDAGGQPTTRTTCLKHDALERLVSSWTATDNCAQVPTEQSKAQVAGIMPVWQSWGFDAVGNRLSQTRHAPATGTTVPQSTSYTYGTPGHAHALTGQTLTGGGTTTTTSYGYDAAGNMTSRTRAGVNRTYTWNPTGTLANITQGSQSTSYTYDVDGTQLLRADPSGTTLFLGSTDVVLAGGVAKATRYYSWAGQSLAQRDPTGVRAMFTDQVATSTTAINWSDLTKVTRRISDPYGNQLGMLNGPWPNGRGFLDLPVDTTTGLGDLGARKYDPETGRFISVDPVLDPGNPLSLNGYAYTNGDPINDADPSGEWSWRSVGNSVKNFGAGAAKYVVKTAVETTQFTATFALWASGTRSWSQANQTTSKYANKAMNAYAKVEDRVGVDRNSKSYKAGYVTAMIIDTVAAVVNPTRGLVKAGVKIGAKLGAKAAKAGGKGFAKGSASTARSTSKNARATTARATPTAKTAPPAKRAAGAITSKTIPATKTAAAKSAPTTNKIYSNRALQRMADEPGPMHNFPAAFDEPVFSQGTRTVNSGYFNKAKPNLSNDSIQYRLSGVINGRSGMYEIFTRPSTSGRTEMIMHRFFRPDH